MITHYIIANGKHPISNVVDITNSYNRYRGLYMCIYIIYFIYRKHKRNEQVFK